MANQTTVPSWVVTPEKVEEAVRKIIGVSHPEKIILFGSYARGATGRNSDLDILVVQRSQWEKLKDVPGLIYREALKTGKVVYESPEAG